MICFYVDNKSFLVSRRRTPSSLRQCARSATSGTASLSASRAAPSTPSATAGSVSLRWLRNSSRRPRRWPTERTERLPA